MVIPLAIPAALSVASSVAGLAGIGISAGANLYAQKNSRKLYSGMKNAYENLYKGYGSYLRQNGRDYNPNRAWASYYGQMQKADTNLRNSDLGSLGTIGGSFGAGSMFAKSGGSSLYKLGKTKRWF